MTLAVEFGGKGARLRAGIVRAVQYTGLRGRGQDWPGLLEALV